MLFIKCSKEDNVYRELEKYPELRAYIKREKEKSYKIGRLESAMEFRAKLKYAIRKYCKNNRWLYEIIDDAYNEMEL